MITKKQAWLHYSKVENRWILRLWFNDEWKDYKSWPVVEVNKCSGIGYVSESLLCELLELYSNGYDIIF